MCGWAGQFGAPVTLDALHRASALLTERGPDDDGTARFEDRVTGGVAHRRLSVVDTSAAGAQPMRDEAGELTLVYNGEIYNAPELRRALTATGARFRGHSDTEVLLEGYRAWGDEVLSRIEGIFSFALVDQRRGRVLLARDRMGVKPLYWALDEGVLVAGSAPRALLALRPGLRQRLDEVALTQFLTLLWIPHPRTPWADVHKLAPAHALAFEDGELRSWRFWDPPESASTTIDPAVLADAVRAATERQLLADVEVGALFSGGLDSTLLVQFMADLRPHDRVPSVTAGYDEASQRLETVPDDLVFAREVAAQDPRLDLREVQISGQAPDALRALDALAGQFDDPVADPAALTLWQLCEQSPATVLLSGVGGEELFAGYPRHRALGAARRLATLPAPMRRIAARTAALGRAGQAGPAHGARRNADKMGRAIACSGTPHYWRMISQLSDHELEALRPGLVETATAELDALSSPLPTTSLADALAFDRAQFLPNLNLAYADVASMAAGIEVRVPLLDERVAQLALAGPADAMIAGGRDKVPLREAARPHVPASIIGRDKSGFGGPVRRWFQADHGGVLAERVEAAADAGLVTRTGARRIYAGASSGHHDWALAAWALVCLNAWHDAQEGR